MCEELPEGDAELEDEVGDLLGAAISAVLQGNVPYVGVRVKPAQSKPEPLQPFKSGPFGARANAGKKRHLN